MSPPVQTGATAGPRAAEPGAAGPVGVIASRVRLDEKRILAALDRRAVPYERLDGRACRYELDAGPPRWPLVLNREIGQVRAAYAARGLEAAGGTVINSAAATELCGDKWRTSVALRRAGLPVPRTALALTPEAALDTIERIGYPAVIKPLQGSWGRLVTAVRDRHAAAAVLEHVAALPSPQSHVVYVQEMVETPGRDVRAIVIGGRLVGAVHRSAGEEAGGWRANVALGATTERCAVTAELAELAEEAARAVGADIAGVDLLEERGERLLVLEVNSGVEFSGFQEAMGDAVDVADRIAGHVAARREGVRA
ncbi:RimK family alpha-L-glutamate ligase [Actinomadura macra]|uniref:RimK family alpha-L-glutamate ligase n=1 Tax=Actinomadura macra TaxID=46164 RepID=UPI000A95CD57|nr:RimK family alpha-L-glutamate ligase [Actinomadura macra]